jgi:hypothetical protein
MENLAETEARDPSLADGRGDLLWKTRSRRVRYGTSKPATIDRHSIQRW